MYRSGWRYALAAADDRGWTTASGSGATAKARARTTKGRANSRITASRRGGQTGQGAEGTLAVRGCQKTGYLLLDRQQLDVEDERRVGRDRRPAGAAVGEVGRDGDSALAAHAHAHDALLEAGDDLARADPEGIRLVARVRIVEYGAVREAAAVHHRHGVAVGGQGARADHQLFGLHGAGGPAGVGGRTPDHTEQQHCRQESIHSQPSRRGRRRGPAAV